MSITKGWRIPARFAVTMCLLVMPLGCSSAAGDPLARWKDALAQRTSAAAVWVAMGDSISEGQGASERSRRWIDRAAHQLEAGEGFDADRAAVYEPGWYAVYGPDSTWTPYASRTGEIKNESFGSLGMRTATLHAGATQTYMVQGTSADVYYLTNGGTMGLSVDGGAPTTVDTAGPYTTGNRRHLSFGSAGGHQVTISALEGAVFLSGLMAFDGDEQSGVHLYDDAHSGYTSGQFVAAGSETGPILALVQPDLVTIELGVNDYLTGDLDPAAVQANLRAIVGQLRESLAAKPPSIVLVLPYRIGSTSRGPDRSWDDYAQATRALGDELDVGVLDMSSMGTAAPGGSWSSDGLHPSDAGNDSMARLATAFLKGSAP